MNPNFARKWRFAAIAVVFAVVLVASLLQGERRAPKHQPDNFKITLVLGMRHGDYWKTVFTGADAAARELGVSVSFLAPDDERDAKGQADLVSQALADGADALIVAPNDDTSLTAVIKEAQQRVPVITIDLAVHSLKVNSHIGTDNYQSGIQAAEEMIRLLNGKPARIGLLGFVQGTPKADLRENGILEKLKSHPEIQLMGKAYCYSDQQLAEELTLRMLNTLGPLDGMIALNSTAAVGAAEVLNREGLARQVKLVAFDSTTQELELLQAGTIRSTVIQNPFGMGYLGVRYAVDALRGQKVPVTVDTGSTVVRTEDMFTPANQKLLFPLLK